VPRRKGGAVVEGVDDRSLPDAVDGGAASSLFRSGKLVLLIALITAAGGFVGGLLRKGQGTVYEAEAVVAASKSPLPADNFTDLGIALFRTDTVLQPVVEELNLNISPQSLLSQGYLKAEPVNNAVAVQIVARDSDPEAAARLANATADSFASALSDNAMGTFAVFEDNEVSTSSSEGALQAALIAAALGVIFGAVLLMVRNLVVRPVHSQAEALGLLPADVAFSARVHTRSPFWWQKDSSAGHEVVPHGLASAIHRTTDQHVHRGQLEACYVLVERAHRGDRAVRSLLDELSVPASRDHDMEGGQLKWLSVTDSRLGEVLDGSGVVIALVSEGVPRRTLQMLTEELLVAPGRRLLVMVFVSGLHRGPILATAGTLPRQSFARMWSSLRRESSGSRSGGL
jgi:hypothetical protein